MGRSFEKQTIQEISMTQDSLSASAATFATAVRLMQESRMDEAWVVWSRKHNESLELMAEAAQAAAAMIAGQVVSHRRGEPSFYDRQKEKTKRQTEKQRETRSAAKSASKSPPKKVGRPKKSK